MGGLCTGVSRGACKEISRSSIGLSRRAMAAMIKVTRRPSPVSASFRIGGQHAPHRVAITAEHRGHHLAPGLAVIDLGQHLALFGQHGVGQKARNRIATAHRQPRRHDQAQHHEPCPWSQAAPVGLASRTADRRSQTGLYPVQAVLVDRVTAMLAAGVDRREFVTRAVRSRRHDRHRHGHGTDRDRNEVRTPVLQGGDDLAPHEVGVDLAWAVSTGLVI